MRSLTVIILLVFLGACGKEAGHAEGEPLARAYDEFLYPEEISEIFPRNVTAADSEQVIRSYIDHWIRDRVLAHKAEVNLSAQEKSVEKQLDEYRKSLIRHKYEMKLVAERLDTTVTDDQIRAYYARNRNNFELKKNVVQLSFVKIEKDHAATGTIRKVFRSSRLQDKATLAELCGKHANNFFLDDGVWLDFEELLKELPIRSYDQEHFLQNNKFLEIEEGNYIYLINIRAYRIKNSVAALEFEKDNIRNILLNERKIALLKEMELSVMREAELNKDIEKYR